jgi:hypothetical protein
MALRIHDQVRPSKEYRGLRKRKTTHASSYRHMCSAILMRVAMEACRRILSQPRGPALVTSALTWKILAESFASAKVVGCGKSPNENESITRAYSSSVDWPRDPTNSSHSCRLSSKRMVALESFLFRAYTRKVSG